MSKSPRSLSVRSFVLGALCSTVLFAGVSAVRAAVSSDTVRACANRRTGVLRLASRCRSSERAVTWSVTGPAGPAGATGPQGERGPSEVVTKVTTSGVPLSGSGGIQSVLSMSLPAGSWYVTATLNVAHDRSVQADTVCYVLTGTEFSSGSVGDVPYAQVQEAPRPVSSTDTVVTPASVWRAVTFSAPGTVLAVCNPGSAAITVNAHLAALAVATITPAS